MLHDAETCLWLEWLLRDLPPNRKIRPSTTEKMRLLFRKDFVPLVFARDSGHTRRTSTRGHHTFVPHGGVSLAFEVQGTVGLGIELELLRAGVH